MLELKQEDLIKHAKEEYLKGDLVMSELLRNEEFAGLSDPSILHLLIWAGEFDPVGTPIDKLSDFRKSVVSKISDISESAVNSFETTAKNIANEAYKKLERQIKKIRWQGHYNTRKRSRRF